MPMLLILTYLLSTKTATIEVDIKYLHVHASQIFPYVTLHEEPNLINTYTSNPKRVGSYPYSV